MDKIFIESAEDYVKFVKHLKSLSKNESIEDMARHKAIINTKREVLCMPMASIRKVAKQISAGDIVSFLKFADGESYEEVLICGLVIAEIKDLDLQIKMFDEWKDKIDCWAICDSVCSSMKKLKLSKDKGKYFKYFCELCYNKEEFISRFGLITLMVNYLEEEYIDEILKICLVVKNEAYYVQMAVAWLLSVAFVKFRDKTLKVIEKQSLPKFTQNKTISKCRDSFRISREDKDMLVKFRIK